METLMTPEIEKAVVRELDSSWCEAELGGMDVADGRLRYRAIDSLKRLSQQPSASIPRYYSGVSEGGRNGRPSRASEMASMTDLPFLRAVEM